MYSYKPTVVYFVLSLLGMLSFVIYLFYRPEEIVMNRYFFHCFPSLMNMKEFINDSIPLNDFLIYNFPSGLWVFSLTILMKNIQLNILTYRFSMMFAPLAAGLMIELFQLLHLTDGTFDMLDIYTMVVFFLLAKRLNEYPVISSEAKHMKPILATLGFVILFFGNR